MMPISSEQRNERRPIGAQLLRQVGQLILGEPAQARPLGLEMHLHEHAEKMHERRHDRGDDDGRIGQVQEFDHQERGRAHDRRRDLAARR